VNAEIIPHAVLSTGARADSNIGMSFVAADCSVERFLSFGEISRLSTQVAAALVRGGFKKGERIGLIIPENIDFVSCFFGAMHAGMVPVPLAPPLNVGRLNVFLDQLRHIVEQGGLSLIITSERIKGLLGTLLGGTLRRISTFAELEVDGEEAPLAQLSEDDLAFLQFTSGSTAKPKGVAITHRNLRENIHCMNVHGVKLREGDVACSWLPLFHDMGLIGFLISPIVAAKPMYLTSPLSFIRRPVVWLEMMSKFRGTISFGPNFSYGLCVKRVKDSELSGLDLHPWRIAGCGAEPIQEVTLRSFAERFQSIGFNALALYPTYGMAESTLGVTFPPTGRALHVDEVDTHEMARTQRAVPAGNNSESRVRIVGCGSAFPEHDVAIFTNDGVHRNEREIGEIVIRGASVTGGYYNNETANAELFVDGWLRTGDLGYLVENELFICGRKKEVIIVAGRNYYPTDVESLIGDLDGIRKGNVIAFGLSDVTKGEETFVICAETKLPESEHSRIEKDVRGRILEAMGIHVGQVVLLAPDSLPKTSSGKLQRAKAKEMFLAEELGKKSLTKEKIDFIKHWAKSQWSYLRNK